jgi:hypothetical protein
VTFRLAAATVLVLAAPVRALDGDGGRPGPEVLARGGNNTWAPDVIRSGDKYFLYYSAPGTQPKAAIGLPIDPGVFRDPTNGSLFSGYNANLYRFANAPSKAIGSNAASVWWVNGTEVIRIYNERQTVIDVACRSA